MRALALVVVLAVVACKGSGPNESASSPSPADDRGRAWVCDPLHGQLLVVNDVFAPSR
jgi:hypothetical protein